MALFADVQYCIYAYKVGGWGQKRPRICWRYIEMTPSVFKLARFWLQGLQTALLHEQKERFKKRNGACSSWLKSYDVVPSSCFTLSSFDRKYQIWKILVILGVFQENTCHSRHFFLHLQFFNVHLSYLIFTKCLIKFRFKFKLCSQKSIM